MKLRAVKRRVQRQQHDHQFFGRMLSRVMVRMVTGALDRAAERIVHKYYDDQRQIIELCIDALTGSSATHDGA